MTILVLGATGRVARLLHGARTTLATPIHFAGRSPITAPDVQIDPATDKPRDVTARLTCRPSLIVSLWGPVAVEEADLDTHAALALWSAELARDCGGARLVAVSTAAVYPKRDIKRPFVESDTETGPAPSAYGEAKRRMEAALHDQPDTVCLRLANVMGADQLADAMRTATSAKPLALDRFANGAGPRRGYLSPLTLTRALVALAEIPWPTLPPVLNLADSPRAYDMADILRAAGADGSPVPHIWRAAPHGALSYHALDTSAIETALPALRRDMRRDAQALVADWRRCEASGPAA